MYGLLPGSLLALQEHKHSSACFMLCRNVTISLQKTDRWWCFWDVADQAYLVIIELQPVLAVSAGEGVIVAAMYPPAMHQHTVKLVPVHTEKTSSLPDSGSAVICRERAKTIKNTWAVTQTSSDLAQVAGNNVQQDEL